MTSASYTLAWDYGRCLYCQRCLYSRPSTIRHTPKMRHINRALEGHGEMTIDRFHCHAIKK